MNKRIPALIKVIPLAALVAAAGCRTTDSVLRDYQQNIAYGNYAVAAREPDECAAKNDDSQLLWQLLAGSAYDLAGHTGTALDRFDAADVRMGYNDNTSVFKQSTDAAMSMMFNDRCFPYDGGGQDRIFTCLYKGILYASGGNINKARTEFNRAAGYQENWLDLRKKDIAAADERLSRDSSSYVRDKTGSNSSVDAAKNERAVSDAMCNAAFASTVRTAYGFDIFRSGMLDKLKPSDYENPFASHIIGVFRWLNGDGGRNYLKDAAELRPDNRYAVADFNEIAKGGRRPSNQVWVYVEDGLCPYRDEWKINLPLFLIPYANKYVLYAGLCLPRLNPRRVAANYWNVNGAAMQEIANVDALVKIEYDVFMRGALKREITRTIIDTAVQVVLGAAAEAAEERARHERWKHDRDDAAHAEAVAAILKLGQIGAAGYAYFRRAADTRSWTALPKRVMLARVQRPADGTITITADGVPATQVVVPRGNAIVFVKKPSSAAPASVKVVSLP